jgi:hypothetical protein
MRQFVQDPALAGGLHHGTGLAQGLELPFQLLELADARCDMADVLVEQRIHVAAVFAGCVLEAQQHADLVERHVQ